MSRLLLPMLVAIVEALAAIGTARLILRVACRAQDRSWLDRSPATQLLVGLPLFGTLLFLAGLVSTSAPAVCAIALPLALYAVVDRIAAGSPTRALLRARDPLGAVALAAAGAIALLFAQMPAFSLDEVAYHLAVPMQWIVSGRVEAFPLISHSWFPFGVESADLFALRLLGHGGAVASHFVRVFCGVALAALLVRRLAAGSATPLLFAAAIVTAPVLLVTAGWSWNEVPLVGVVVVLFLALDELANGRPALALIGLAVSAGLATKYTFAPIALLLLAVAFTVVDRTRRLALLRAAAIGGAFGSIFFVRNALQAGNPFEPILREGTGDVGFRWTGNWLGTLGSYVFDLRIFDEALGFSLLLLAFCSLAHLMDFARPPDGLRSPSARCARLALAARDLRSRSRFERWSCLALLFACAALAPLTPSARVFVPFLVVPALVGAETVGRFRAAPRRAIAAVLGVAVAAQLTEAALYASAHDPLALLAGRSSVPSWLAHQRPVTSDVLWIDARLPAQSRALVLGVQELFWFSHEVRGGGNNDGPRVAAYLRAGDPDQLRERLRRDGITHVALGRAVVDAPSEDWKHHERETLLDAATVNLVGTLLQTQRRIAAKGPLMVFELQ
jgi:hypothetical protein